MDTRQMLGAGAIVGVVGLVAAVALLTADHTPDLKEHWASGPMPGVEEPGDVVATWLTDDAVVAVTAQGTWSFDAATGERRWGLTVRDSGLAPCAASSEPNADGIAALLFEEAADRPEGAADTAEDEEGRRCDIVGAVDIHTGELLWSERLEFYLRPSGWPGAPVTIGEEVITVDLEAWATYRFSLEGSELPLPDHVDSERCPDDTRWVQGRDITLAIPLCTEATITVFATQSGDELWTTPTPPRWSMSETYAVVSDAPPLVIGYDRATPFEPDGSLTEPTEFGGRLNGPPLLLGESQLVAPVGKLPELSLRGADLATGAGWVHRSREGSLLAGAGEDHALLLSPATDTDGDGDGAEEVGEYHLLRVGAANGTAKARVDKEGVIHTEAVLAAVADEDTLYTVTAGKTPGGHPEAHLVAHGR